MGGLGLTTGLLDATVCGNALGRIFKGESDSLLDKYAESRRKVFLTFTNPVSILNKERVMSTDPVVIRKREEFFDKISNDKEFRRNMRSGLVNLLPDSLEGTVVPYTAPDIVVNKFKA